MASPGAPSPAASPLRRLAGERRGIAAVEFAIGAAFIVVAMLALYDFGRASWHRMQVVSAAQAGAVYAAAHGFNTNGIVAAVIGATDFATIAATPAPSMQCGCPGGASGLIPAACGTTCASINGAPPQPAGYYVTVNARGTYTFMFPYPYVTQPVVMTASAIAKLQ